MSEYISNRQRQLNVGISSYTEDQLVLNVIGDTRISGITTIGEVTITPSGIITSSNPGVSTVVYYGDGSHLIGVNAFNVVTQDDVGSPVYPTFASSIGVSSIGISSEKFVFIPNSGFIGIGTTNPTTNIQVVGNGLFSGIVSATEFNGTLGSLGSLSVSGFSTLGSYSATSGSLGSLNVSGISTFGNVNSTGIITAFSFVPSSGYIKAPDGTNAFFIYNGTGNIAFQGTIGASQINNASGYKVLGFNGTNSASFENNLYIAGITTSVGGFVGNLTGTATTATNLSDAANITTGTISTSRLSGSYNISISGSSNYSTSSGVSTNVVGGIGSLSSLTVSGITTLGIVTSDNIFSTGIVTATSFVGSGLNLTNIRIGISSNDSVIGTAGTINFTGTGVSSITVSSGIATVNIPATVRNTSYTVAYEGQTIFPCSYTVGFVDVYFNGSKLSSSQYSAPDGANVILVDPASANDVIETVGYTGILKLYSSKTILTDVSSNGLTFYTGKAAVGIGTTQAAWTIRRSLFSSAGIVTSVGIARNIAWSNRTSGIYT